MMNETEIDRDDRWQQWIVPVVSILLLALGLYAVHAITSEIRWPDVKAAIVGTPPMAMIMASLLTIGSYMALTGYDSLALRHLGYQLPYRTAALASFTSYTMAHTLGLTALTGGSVRYRIYSAAKVSGADIAIIIALCGFTFWLSAIGLLGISLLLEPSVGAIVDHIGPTANSALGLLLLTAVVAYTALTATRNTPLRIGNWQLVLPGINVTGKQLALGIIDIFCAGGTLYMLQPDADLSVSLFASAYIVALTLGAMSHSPGGIGVFEALMMLMLPGVEKGGLLGALLLYRVIYTLVPFALGASLLLLRESRFVRHRISPVLAPVVGMARTSAPLVIAGFVFLSGLVLLLSAATPTALDRVKILADAIPLPLVEVSHLSASLIGITLMALAWGLNRRLSSAFTFAVPLLATGAAAAILKGFDYEEALVLLGALAMLLANRSAFYRKSRLMDEPMSPAWALTLVAAILLAAFAGLIAYRHVPYNDDLWLNFDIRSDASRYLRSGLIVTAAALATIVWFALRRPRHKLTSSLSIGKLESLLATARRSDANLALLGDKQFLLSPGGDAFLMYSTCGNSWIVMGDPVGNPEAFADLLWQFCECVDLHGGRAVFYEVSPAVLPHMIELGMQIFKQGEEARVPLADFSLEGPAGRDHRQAIRRVEKTGATFDILPAAHVAHFLPELKAVSDAWLVDKQAHEKGFSLGRFDPAYLQHFDIGVLRLAGKIVAFANIWVAPGASELSIDLMRFHPDAPRGSMDYLFVQLMLWGKARGFAWFNLGMAPLSGLENHPLAPLWAKIGHFIFMHGENFYNFEGLRFFKEKYQPVWQPVYLACPSGRSLPRALVDCTRLIRGAGK